MPAACLLDPEASSLASVSGAPDATFLNPAVNVQTGSWPQVLGAADFDGTEGDGRSQFAAATERYFDPANDRQLHLFAMSGAPTPQRLQRLPAGISPEAAQPLDTNHDGVSDLVLALAGDSALAVYLGGAGPLGAPELMTLDGPTDALAAGDVSGDLRDDLIAIVGDTIRFWRSSSDGLVALPLSLPYPNDGYNALAVGDFDNDGYADIAAMRGAGYAEGSVALFFQRGAAFVPGPELSPRLDGFVPAGIAVGDLDGDGQDDLAVAAGGNVPNAYLSIFYQKGGILDTEPTVIDTFHIPSAIVAVDVSHDGHEDLLLTNDGWRTLSIFQGYADGIDPAYLAADIPYSDRYRPDALAVSDVDGNGSLDPALVGYPHGLTVLTGMHTVPRATITEPPEAARLPSGYTPVLGVASAGAVSVQVRVKGISDWQSVPVAGGLWQALVALPADPRPYTIEARAVGADGRVQAPWTRRQVMTNLVCYALADNADLNGSADRLVRVDMATGAGTIIGAMGTRFGHSLAFDASGTLYTTDGSFFGTVDLATGAFRARAQRMGRGRGAQGSVTINDVAGLNFDPISGTLYAVMRRGVDRVPDLLFQINPATGVVRTDAFGPGVDYVPLVGPGVLADIDDLAFTDDGSTLYGVSNRNGSGDVLVTINRATGATSVVGALRVANMEGLTYAPDGALYGTTGSSHSATGDRLWRIDAASGAASLVGRLGVERDYEGLACLPQGTLPPASSEALQPRLVDFQINDGAAAETSTATVTLRAQALVSPGVPAPAAVLLAEYRYDVVSRSWQPIGRVERVSPEALAAGVSWELQALRGARYLQAWAVSADGTVTLPAQQAFINYLPEEVTIAVGERHVFRYSLLAGETLATSLRTPTGGADIALWAGDDPAPLAVGEVIDGTKQLAVTAESAGIYQLEVIGAGATTYKLTVSRSLAIAAATRGSGALGASQAVPAASVIGAPTVSPWSAPDRYALPGVEAETRHFLPLVLR